MKSAIRLLAVILGGMSLVVPQAVFNSASAATCQSFAASGVRVCGTWNASLENHGGVNYATTSSFTWSVTRLDSTIRITKVTVRMGGNSRCSASPGYSQCKVFGPTIQNVSRASTGSTTSVPSWHGKLGLVAGQLNYQLSNLTIRWCHGTSCQTNTTFNLGAGKGI